MKPKRSLIVGSLLATLALLAAACGGEAESGATDPGTASTSDLTVNKDARAMLPADIRESGTLSMATSLQWAPFGYKDENGDAVGIDIDLIRGITAALGLELDLNDVEFQSMIPGVANGRFDLAMNQIEDTPERRKEAQFVHYYEDTIRVITDGDSDIDPENLCGSEIAVTQGSSQQYTLEGIDQECEDSGEDAISMKVFPDTAGTILAVQGGRVESMLMGYASANYLKETSAQDLTILPEAVPDTEALTGIVIAKDNDELAAAVQAATQTLVDNGWYKDLLDKYGVGENALKKITVGKS